MDLGELSATKLVGPVHLTTKSKDIKIVTEHGTVSVRKSGEEPADTNKAEM
jgi:hypothetical protein